MYQRERKGKRDRQSHLLKREKYTLAYLVIGLFSLLCKFLFLQGGSENNARQFLRLIKVEMSNDVNDQNKRDGKRVRTTTSVPFTLFVLPIRSFMLPFILHDATILIVVLFSFFLIIIELVD